MPFRIIRNDITKVKADAIVNTANPEPRYAAGTDAAIYQAAGAEVLLAARRKIGRIAQGEAAVTKAFRLPAKYIIHTVGPAWIDGKHGEFETLRSCYRKSLLLAEQLGCESIAFPLIATGVYGFPKDKALEIALSVFREHLADSDINITLVVFGSSSYQIAASLMDRVEEYIDENYVAAQTAAEYGGSFSSRTAAEYGGPTNEYGMPSDGEVPKHGSQAGADYAEALESRARSRRRQDYLSDARRRELRDQEMASNLMLPPLEAPMDDEWEADAEESAPTYSAPMFPAPSADRASARKAPVSGSISPSVKQELSQPKISSAKTEEAGKRKPSLEDAMSNLGESFQQRLLRMIDERGMTDPEVYKRANIDRKLFSKIRCNESYMPKKKTIIALAIALQLNLDDTRDLLASAGLLLTNNSKSDVIVSFCIENGMYDIFDINSLLFEFGQPILG